MTQRVDEASPAVWNSVAKIRALAARLDELTVLTLWAAEGEIAPNCRVVRIGAPVQTLRGGRFMAALGRELALRRPAAVLAHMSPIYARLAAPVARPLGVRTLLWYASWRSNALLERTVRHVDAVLTVNPRSFPFDSPKVRSIGHGIDVARFRCAEPHGHGELQLVALGRYTEVKSIGTILRALPDVSAARLAVHGTCERESERSYRLELRRLADELGLDGRVELGDPVLPDGLPELLARADALVSATPGGADKVVLEAGAACLPAFASAPAYADLLPRELQFADAEGLAAALREFAAQPAEERARTGRELHERVVAQHSVDAWADRVLEAAGL
jgi:glycosyltransferase involved in cell wall biosynthesis